MGKTNSTGKREKGSGRSDGVIRAIGIFRLLKAVLLLAAGLGALKYLHHDVAAEIEKLLQHWHVDPENHYFQALVSKVSHVDDHSLVLMSVATFFYAGLFLTEGIGLLMKKRWAEWLTVVATASFIPLEVYHLIRNFSGVKIAVIVVNVAIVVYLLYRLKKDR